MEIDKVYLQSVLLFVPIALGVYSIGKEAVKESVKRTLFDKFALFCTKFVSIEVLFLGLFGILNSQLKLQGFYPTMTDLGDWYFIRSLLILGAIVYVIYFIKKGKCYFIKFRLR